MGTVCVKEQHDVKLESGYKHDKACTTLVDYNGQEHRELFASTLPKWSSLAIQ